MFKVSFCHIRAKETHFRSLFVTYAFIVNYNMMNVRSECFLQTIDKNRIKTYEEDFKKYEEDLKKYKEEHGRP